MASSYYKKCEELTICEDLISKYWESKEFEKCFLGHLELAERTSYPLAECQVGYFYLEGIGCNKDLEKALYWTNRAAMHGDRDGECNLAFIYENGLCGQIDLDKAKYWYKKAALQNHDIAIKKCIEYRIWERKDEKDN